MKALVSLMLSVGLAGCSASLPLQPNPAPAQAPVTTERVMSPDGSELVKVITPTVTSENAKQAVLERFRGSRIDNIEVELQDLQWAANNLAYAQHLYTSDSPVWIASVTGELPGEPGMRDDGTPVPHTFKSGKLAVAADTGQIISVTLYNGEFVPAAIQPGNTGSRVVSANPSPSPAVKQ